MKIDQLRKVLVRFGKFHADHGAAEKGAVLHKLATELAAHDKKTVKTFVKNTLQRRTRAVQKS